MTRRRSMTAPLAVVLALAGWAGAASARELAPARPEEVGLSGERLGRLGRALDAYAAQNRLAGGVVLVARRGRVAYLHTFGKRDIESGAGATPDTIFRIASQTKALVSVTAMVLQEEGKLLLSHPVGRYIPEFQKTTVAVAKEGGYDVVDARRPITLRDLLTHTAGLSYAAGPAKERWLAAGLPDWYFAERDEPMGAIVPRMAALPFDTQPGEKWVYGFATDVLGVALERASGQSLDELIRTRILEPLAMNDTHFYLPVEKRGRLATVYKPKADGTIERAPDRGGRVSQGAYVEGPRKAFAGGAGMLSTASDYARFLQMLLNGGALDGRRILSRKSVELMTAGHLGDMPFRDGQDFGLGFAVVEDLGERGTPGSVGEYSWGGAYHTNYWVDPKEKLVVTYMTQLIGSGPPIDDQDTVRALVYQAIVD